MAAWITPEDVLGRWLADGSRPSANDTTLLTLIEDAEDAILEVFPRIQERIDSQELPMVRVKRVVAGVVIRVYNLAQEYRASFSEATGPFSHSVSMGTEYSRNVVLTAEEIKTLSPDNKKKAFTVSMAPNAHSGEYLGWLQ